MIDRRKFLERSALGAGSVLFSSVLLESCTKYGIPFPPGNPHPGPDPGTGLTEDELGINWNDGVRETVIFGIGKIPVSGEVLSALVGHLWPKSPIPNPFDKMKSQVEALIDRKLDDLIYNQVKGALGNLDSGGSGLAKDISVYTQTVTAFNDDPTTTKPETVIQEFSAARHSFNDSYGSFTVPGYQVLLLPLFAQYANLYLTLLRDGALHGKEWGMDQITYDSILSDLQNYTTNWPIYVDNTYKSGVDTAMDASFKPENNSDDLIHNHYLQPFTTSNAYIRQTTFDVMDFRDTWEYYDVVKYPKGITGADGPIKPSELLKREIYSDPRGTALIKIKPASGSIPNVNQIPMPSPSGGAPITLPSRISIFSDYRINTIQLEYPTGGGPGGITQTDRMGGHGGSSSGAIVNSNSNPINQFRCSTLSAAVKPNTPVLSSLQFAFFDKTTTQQFGGKDTMKRDDWGWVGYPGRAVSSIFTSGPITVFSNDTVANCVVVGFKHWDSPASALRTVRFHYITSPSEKTMADLVKTFPGVAIPTGLINQAKAERLAHWARMKASAKR